jgi:hypothetical protein
LLTNGMYFTVAGGNAGTTVFKINYDTLANGEGSGSMIVLTAIPEPGTASLLGLVGLAFLVRHLRRRFQKQA